MCEVVSEKKSSRNEKYGQPKKSFETKHEFFTLTLPTHRPGSVLSHLISIYCFWNLFQTKMREFDVPCTPSCDCFFDHLRP